MMLFRRRPGISRDEALAARPIRRADALLEPTDNGGGRIRVAVQPSRFGRWILRMPTGGMTRTFELDAVGVFVWDLCDGRSSVQQIIRKLAERYRLNLREAEVSSLQFLHTLTRKGLIGMELKKPTGKGR